MVVDSILINIENEAEDPFRKPVIILLEVGGKLQKKKKKDDDVV